MKHLFSFFLSFFLVAQSCPTLYNPMDTRLLHPWDFLGKSTGVGCHFLLQGRWNIYVTICKTDSLYSQSYGFSLVMDGIESWTIKKAECRRIDAFELWCWKRLLRVPWTARRSNQSILKEFSPGCSLERLMLKLKLQYFGLPMQEMQETRVQSLGWEDPLEEEMATHPSILAWRIPWTEDPGRLLSIGSQRVRHDCSDLAHH